MNYFLLTLGSNTHNGAVLINKAIEEIQQISETSLFSSIYTTPPEGKEYSGSYLNCVAFITTVREFDFWEHFFKSLEGSYGRDESARKNKIVPVDADITVWNDEIVRPQNLKMNYIKRGIIELQNSNPLVPDFLSFAK